VRISVCVATVEMDGEAQVKLRLAGHANTVISGVGAVRRQAASAPTDGTVKLWVTGHSIAW
jgi:hypothetical protein